MTIPTFKPLNWKFDFLPPWPCPGPHDHGTQTWPRLVWWPTAILRRAQQINWFKRHQPERDLDLDLDPIYSNLTRCNCSDLLTYQNEVNSVIYSLWNCPYISRHHSISLKILLSISANYDRHLFTTFTMFISAGLYSLCTEQYEWFRFLANSWEDLIKHFLCIDS